MMSKISPLALRLPIGKRLFAIGKLLFARLGARQAELKRLRIENSTLVAEARALSAERNVLRTQLTRLRAEAVFRSGPSACTIGRLEDSDLLKRCFTVPLADLGSRNSKYAGVLCPLPEFDAPKVGVGEMLLGGAEDYFRKFQNYDYVFSLISAQLRSLGVVPKGLALDFGSGFGNTVIPLLENFSELNIIATDISPDLLAILQREADKRGVRDRCVTVALDAQRDYFAPECAEMVFGVAVLHHLASPDALLRTVMKVLKPGSRALFFEPFEDGHSILRLAYEDILRSAQQRGEIGTAFEFLGRMVTDIAARTHQQQYPGLHEAWFNLDDKWLFTRTYFEEIRDLIGASKIDIRPLNARRYPFTSHTQKVLREYAGLPVPQCLPDWAWEILLRYDEEAFSPAMRNDLVIEGAVVITK